MLMKHNFLVERVS